MENLNLSLPLITFTLLTLHCTAFHLFLKHRCYLQNIFYFFPSWTFEKCIKSSIFSFFETPPLVQNNGNMSLSNMLNFQLGSKYTSETLNRFYFDYLILIWLSYMRIFYQFHKHIYQNISKIHFQKKIQKIWCLRLTGHILEL